LLSQRIADDLAQYGRWQAFLHNVGEAEVKHGVRLGIVSLYDGEFGNAVVPEKIRRARAARRRRLLTVACAIAGLLIVGTAGFLVYRHQTAVRERATAEAAAQREKSVAVLPFESLTTNEQNNVFTGGVHREVLSNLAKVADLKVISRTSVMHYKPGGDRNIRQIANDLGVNYVVEGTVQRDAANVRVTVELVDARTDTEAWSETYDGKIGDVLAFQSEIAERISNQLGAKLSPRESTELARRPTQDIAAFEAYIRARALMETPDLDDDSTKFREDYTRAVQLLEQAVARDPKFAGAYWALSEANIQLYRGGEPPNIEHRARAEAALKEAQRIAPEAGETFYAQARITYYGYYDFTRALATLEEAAKSLPNSAEVTITRALLYRRFGRWQEAYALFVRSSELNPRDLLPYISAGGAALELRWWDELDQMAERIKKHFPRRASVVAMEHAVTLRLRGDVAAGNKEMESVKLQMPGDFAPLFYIPFWKRDFEECRRLVTEAAKYSELQDERWDKQLQLAFVTKFSFDEQAAREAEKRLEKRLAGSIQREEQGDLVIALSNVKMLLGKKKEALRIAEESVEQHPISEDALANVDRLKRLAFMYLYAGENDRALQTFAKLVQLPGGEYFGELEYNPILDGLRQDPRFEQILRQARQPFPRL
jgi:TolB-like protein